MITIRRSTAADVEVMFGIWSRAVRATHHFLSEEDMAFFSDLVWNEYLPGRPFWIGADGTGVVLGFMATTGDKLEALFVDPDHHGKGIGRLLATRAFAAGATTVDVNEQNTGALRFYRALGFREIGRSDRDDSGRPYPLIRMRLAGA